MNAFLDDHDLLKPFRYQLRHGQKLVQRQEILMPDANTISVLEVIQGVSLSDMQREFPYTLTSSYQVNIDPNTGEANLVKMKNITLESLSSVEDSQNHHGASLRGGYMICLYCPDANCSMCIICDINSSSGQCFTSSCTIDCQTSHFPSGLTLT